MGKVNLLRLVPIGVCLGCFAMGGGVQARAAAAGQPALLVVNQGDVDVSIVDAGTARQIATIPEKVTGVHAHEAATSPDGRTLYLPIYGSVGVGKPGVDGHEMLVVDLATRKITGRVDFGHGVRPHFPIYDKTSGMLYVTTELDKTVSVIDPKTLKIVGAVPTGQEQSHMLVLSHDGKRGYTANVGPGTVSVLDMVGRKTVAVIPISGNTQRISITPDDKWVFTADQTKAQMAAIDTATNSVTKWIPMEAMGYGSTVTPDGKWLLVAMPDQNKVAVIDVKTMQVARTVPVGDYPQEVLVRPDGKRAYVSCMHGAGTVSEIDLGSWKVTRTITTGNSTDGLAWAGK